MVFPERDIDLGELSTDEVAVPSFNFDLAGNGRVFATIQRVGDGVLRNGEFGLGGCVRATADRWNYVWEGQRPPDHFEETPWLAAACGCVKPATRLTIGARGHRDMAGGGDRRRWFSKSRSTVGAVCDAQLQSASATALCPKISHPCVGSLDYPNTSFVISQR